MFWWSCWYLLDVLFPVDLVLGLAGWSCWVHLGNLLEMILGLRLPVSLQAVPLGHIWGRLGSCWHLK